MSCISSSLLRQHHWQRSVHSSVQDSVVVFYPAPAFLYNDENLLYHFYGSWGSCMPLRAHVSSICRAKLRTTVPTEVQCKCKDDEVIIPNFQPQNSGKRPTAVPIDADSQGLAPSPPDLLQASNDASVPSQSGSHK